MKQCRKCFDFKSIDQFQIDRKRKDGRYPNCRDCHKSYMRYRYANQPGVRDKHLQQQKQRLNDPTYVAANKRRNAKHYSSVHGRAKTLLRGALKRDPTATITLEHIVQMLENGVCPVTHIPFDMRSDFRIRTGRHLNPYAPSLDQIEPGGGYTNGNTRLVIWQYNQMKGQLNDAETFMICHAVVRNSPWI